ncbi:MAG: T9SS type A sorting domain-containing protein [Bacteroidia bacterium]|nr:T9SS type A sorting domain-containing protein [Bacteroidia bacterium]
MKLIKRIFLLPGLLLILSLGLQAQQVAPIGTWTSYSSHHYPKGMVKKGSLLHVISRGGLYTYDINNFKIKTYSTIDGLSGNNSNTIYYDPSSQHIFVGYDNGMINYFSDISSGEITFITDIKRSENYTSKGINRFHAQGDILYIATKFGVVAYDVVKKETRSSYPKISRLNTGSEVYDLTIFHDSLFLAMGDSGLYTAPLNHPNLADPNAWKRISGGTLPGGNVKFVTQAHNMVYAVVEDTVFRKNGSIWETAPMGVHTYGFFHAENDILVGGYQTFSEALYPGDSLVLVDNGGRQIAAYGHQDFIWIADSDVGLLRFKAGAFSKVNPEGPTNNYVAKIVAGAGEFYIAPKGRAGTYRYFDQSGIYYHTPTDGWKILNHRDKILDDTLYRDFSAACYDPATGKCYLGSCGEGVLVLKNGEVIDSYTPYNSGILGNRDTFPFDLRVSDLALDSKGNLWVLIVLQDSDHLLQVRTKAGAWYNYKLSGGRPTDLVIDELDNKWVINDQVGIYVFNENGTFDVTSDDQLRKVSNSIGNGALPTNDVLSAVVDLNGHIWVGTGDGVHVFYDPYSIFTSNFSDGSCPVFENQCLMKSQKVLCITVDGANRKWIGTNNGVYLISEDGTEQVYHFTTENSPIFSDVINTIAVEPSTGEVFIGTEEGLISFMGDAIEGKANSEELYVFPNPVMSDFDGLITIRGSVAEAKVKIVNTNGQLVREMDSNGGQATWDARDQWGNRVKSGIYVVMVADKEGRKAGYTKVTILNQE